ncbi:MAG: MmcQ/YjbR family DNA-binding protein [Bacteroidetes bacterium]|jgi:predicted DNA-binding protein (MmcQ/YjbR family)|nr:MmcQ/YjbR family DNA-binding protein [Bacteroidota bacterium]
MNIEEVRSYCLQKPAVTEGFPFGPNALVFKVLDKMYALLNLEDKRINLKCAPHKAQELREKYEAVIPGYHMNKKHWNTIILDGTVPDPLIKEWIDHSYDLIVEKLPKSQKTKLNAIKDEKNS